MPSKIAAGMASGCSEGPYWGICDFRGEAIGWGGMYQYVPYDDPIQSLDRQKKEVAKKEVFRCLSQ